MSVAKILSNWRKQSMLTFQEVSAMTGIDQALLSKYENGKRLPSEKHLLELSAAMEMPFIELRRAYLADKIYEMLAYEEAPMEILQAAETRMEYLSSKNSLDTQQINNEVTEKLAAVKKLLDKWQAAKLLGQTQLQKMKEYFDVSYTYDSNRIEGNTLTMQETHLVINDGITISGKSMREHLEAINHYEAIDFVRGMVNGKEDINKRNLLDIHRLILKSIDNENAGVFRSVGVRISGSAHIPPDPLHLDSLMDEFFMFYQKNKKTMHPIILAAEMHERLVSIHPFIDGNGRTARLLMNFILLKNGYTVAILKGDISSRLAYYKALEHVQVKNDPNPFYMMIAQKVEDSLSEHLEMV